VEESLSPKKATVRDVSTLLDMTNTKMADKIIVALDVPTKVAALALVDQLREQISFFKIGFQLYTAEGPEIVRAVLSTGAKVFLDLKLHDIPNTVARAVESATNLGVHMLTIHLSGGSEMIRAATAARANNISILGDCVNKRDGTNAARNWNRPQSRRAGFAPGQIRCRSRNRWNSGQFA